MDLTAAPLKSTSRPNLPHHRGKILERDKFDVDKFGSPTSYQIFPSILRMRCVKGQQPSRGHQEITAAIHYDATARDLIPNFSFISKDQFQIFPPLILALPKKPPQIIPPVVRNLSEVNRHWAGGPAGLEARSGLSVRAIPTAISLTKISYGNSTIRSIRPPLQEHQPFPCRSTKPPPRRKVPGGRGR